LHFRIVRNYIIKNNLQGIEYTPEEIERMMTLAKEEDLARVRNYAGQLARGEA
jgi:ribosomal protein L17